MLLLYLMRKSLVSKAAVYGLLSAIFIVLDGLFYGKIDYIQMVESVFFDIGYFILFFERKREKRKTIKIVDTGKKIIYIKN